MILNFFYHSKTYTDSEYVEGCKNENPDIQQSLYEKAKQAFEQQKKGFSALDEEDLSDLFQESYILFWEKIQNGQIFVKSGVLYARGKSVLHELPGLTGYFMKIVQNKYKEKLRELHRLVHLDLFRDTDKEDVLESWEEDVSTLRYRLINDCIKSMSNRCRDILTLYYYERKSLNEILMIRPENQSYDGLKTGKAKCMKQLKQRINQSFIENGLYVPHSSQ